MANLEDLIDPEYGLQQDEWSLTRPRFGEEGQLEVIGWSGKTGSNKLYVMVCHNCKKDPEMYAEGVFVSGKSNLLSAKMPCGCSKGARRSKAQWEILILRKCLEVGYTFLGFTEPSVKARTKIKLRCSIHGSTWETTEVCSLLSKGRGCPVCKIEAISKKAMGNSRTPKIVKETSKLHQDEWSLSRPVFGDKGQVVVVGWRGKTSGRGLVKSYIVECEICSKDEELFPEKLFTTTKSQLVAGSLPCGCAKSVKWRKDQWLVKIKRVATERGYVFNGFAGDFRGHGTRLLLACKEHGPWSSTPAHTFVGSQTGCPECGRLSMLSSKMKTTEEKYSSFENEKKIKVIRILRKTLQEGRGERRRAFSECECKICGETFMSYLYDVIKGRGCPVCNREDQTFSYIHVIRDGLSPISLKFGITLQKFGGARLRSQNRQSIFTVESLGCWEFESSGDCQAAERECKQTLECGVLTKEEMPDGYTETTWAFNLDKIISIYEKHGGKRIK